MKVVILCGGSGSRLWPLSRTQYPKQFIRLKRMEHTIFQMTIKRALLFCSMENIYFVAGEDYKDIMIQQIEEIGLTPQEDNFLYEPTPKNTLPAIYYAVCCIRKKGEDIVVVLPSDHVIEDDQGLADIICSAKQAAENHLVIFGIKPTAPETAYGYIKPGTPYESGFVVESFKEKPDLETARKYVNSGYLWNSGMFMFGTEVFAEELKKYNPDVFYAFEDKSVENCFKATPAISIDYGLIEKSDKDIVFSADIGWSDLGNFFSFYDKYDSYQDEQGNICFNSEIILDGNNDLIYSDSEKTIAIIGLSDTIIIDQEDALLVCNRNSTGKIRDIVDVLIERQDEKVKRQPTEYRQWGTYRSVKRGGHFNMATLTILPGKQFICDNSACTHCVVESGTACVCIENEQEVMRAGESINIDKNKNYAIKNISGIKLEVVLIQSGDNLQELHGGEK